MFPGAVKSTGSVLLKLSVSSCGCRGAVNVYVKAARAPRYVCARVAMLRSVMLNHWYHHRGQLTVYLRELGVPIPSIYGPSADENPFA